MTTIPETRLNQLVARWQTVQGALSQGTDQETYVRLSREFAELDPIVATINALRKAEQERDDLKAMIDDPSSDAEMSALAEEEPRARCYKGRQECGAVYTGKHETISFERHIEFVSAFTEETLERAR